MKMETCHIWQNTAEKLAFLLQSPADFHDTRRNDWRRQRNESTTLGSIQQTSRSEYGLTVEIRIRTRITFAWAQQEVKVIWQKTPHGGPIPRLGVTPRGRNLYHWHPGVGFPISVP